MGILQSLWTQSFPPQSKFTPDDIPDLFGKVIIVTGANTGAHHYEPAQTPSMSANGTLTLIY